MTSLACVAREPPHAASENANDETVCSISGRQNLGYMTWQQKQDFANHKKGYNYNKADQSSSKRPAQRKIAGDTVENTIVPVEATGPTVPSNLGTAESNHANCDNCDKCYNYHHTNNPNMTSTTKHQFPMAIYVPPHLRNKAHSSVSVPQPVDAPPVTAPPVTALPAGPSHAETPPVQTRSEKKGSSVLDPTPSAATANPPNGYGTWGGWEAPKPDPTLPAATANPPNGYGTWGGWEAPKPDPTLPAAMANPPNGYETWGGWEPEPEPEPPQSKQRNSRRRKPPPRRAHQWPKMRDMRAHSTDDAEDDGDGGVACKSDSNGDPHYDVKKLIDWNGDWLPPPESWGARKGFEDRHFGAGIEKWINGHDKSCTVDLTNELSSLDFLGRKLEDGSVDEAMVKVTTKELAPRTWVPAKIEGDAPQQFWRAHSSRAPPALSDVELSERQPFWENYPAEKSSCFLDPPLAPAACLDSEDLENKHPRVQNSAADSVREINEIRENKARRQQRRRNQPLPPTVPLPPVPQLLIPTANVYLRPVKASDAPAIRDIYNWYVAETIGAPEYTNRTTRHIVHRMNVVTEEGLPYIVAVSRNGRPNTNVGFITEEIVGFASLDDFCDKGSMYRFSFELEFYVHPQHTRKGIAKCLLDRLLETVSTGYPVKGGYEWINRGEYLKNGARRVVKTINVSVPHSESEDITWLTSFLRKFQFRKAGHLIKMGYKKDQVVDVTIYQHNTSELIDPKAPPRDPL